MTTTTLERPVEAPAAACRHHWILDNDSSAETTGVCRRCGATRTFQNHLPGDRYAKEWREARLYATVLDRRFAPLPAAPDHDDNVLDS
ncbi:MAG: hypothetical protein KatS3mg060_2022 [Dehalococcoidia bacterium]|nr:MAG: hypothetical protein KatS3mg060_2022 [Dehalococcoidia bacterium]